MLIIAFKRIKAKPINFGIPVISIGNIIVGGSGKTPLTINLAKKYEDAAVILRGYGRESKGLYIISHKGEILEDVKVSGDEAMLYATSLKNATVIVSVDREKAILKAKELGCKIVFLDDGFSKYNIYKFDILIRPKEEPTNLFCLPSGGYREPKMNYSLGNLVLHEGIDFKRVVNFYKDGQQIDVLPFKLVVLTAISKPKRVLEFLPEGTELFSFEDHHVFIDEDIKVLKEKYPNYSIITTEKDFVKLQKFKIKDLYLMKLELEIFKDTSSIDRFIESFKF